MEENMQSTTFLVNINHALPNDTKLVTNFTDEFYLEQLNQQAFTILIPSFIVILVVIVLGIPGNLITVWVYLRKMRRTASRVFILSLALCDLVNCLFTMPVEIAIIAKFWTFDHPVLCCISRTLTYILNGTSALLLCGIAVDRFRKICRPLKPVFTPKQTKGICLISFALGFTVYIPGFVLYGTSTEEFRYGSNTIVGKTCQIRDQYRNSKIMDYIISFWFLLTVIVMVVLIVVYSMIGRAVYKRMKLEEERQNSVYSKKNSKSKRPVVADRSSETSCSFNDDIASNHRNVLNSVPKEVTATISERLKNRLSNSNVYSVNRVRTTQRIRAGRTTMMLLAVTVAYILSFIPFVVIVIIRSTSDPHYYTMLSDAEKRVWDVFLRSYVLNCAVNPILYGFFNKDFRRKMLELFRDCLCC